MLTSPRSTTARQSERSACRVSNYQHCCQTALPTTLYRLKTSFCYLLLTTFALFANFALAYPEDNSPHPQQIESSSKTVELTENEKTWLKAHPLIAIGGKTDWAPVEFVNEHGQYQGISNDYLALIAQKTGLKFNVSTDQWTTHLQNFRKQKIDILTAAYRTEERNHYADFSTAYFEMVDYFFIRDDLNISSLQDLNGKRAAIPDGYAQVESIKKNFPKIQTLKVANIKAAIDAVLEGRADVLYDSYAILSHTLKKEAINSIIPFKSSRNIGLNSVHFMTRKDTPELTSIIQKGLDSISEQEKEGIHNKWLGVDNRPEINTFHIRPEEQRWLDAHRIIRFTGDPNWLPYEAFDKQGNYIGIVADHLKLIEQKLGIQLTIVPVSSWDESIAKIKRGDVDVLSETSDSDLTSELSFTQAYLSSPIVIVMHEDESYVENIDKIKHKKIALIRNYGYVPKIIKKYPTIDFQWVDTIQEGLTAVSTGKADALISTLAQASYHIAKLGINNVRIIGRTQFTTKLAFGFRDEFAPLAPLFNRALNDIKPSEKQKIFNNWGEQRFEEKLDYSLLAKIIVSFLFVLAIFAYWNRKLSKEINLRKKLEEQTQSIIDNIPLQITICTHKGWILSANFQALNDYKISESEITNYNISSFFVNEKDNVDLFEELELKGEVRQKILPFKHIDGEIRSLMISVIAIQYNRKPAFLTISVDMTTRLKQEEELAKARDKAELANRAKSEFLSNMSHEIRTPMNAIIGFSALLQDDVKDPKHKSFVNTIHSAGINLMIIINDILDLSKIEAGKLDIEKTPCNVARLFTDIADIFDIQIKDKQLDLMLDIANNIPSSILIDATRLRQVLLNIIGNAIKFTDQGFIRVSARVENADKILSKIDLLIEIEDSGIGISKNQQTLIFEDFAQSEGQDNKRFGGTGLGLSISKRLVGIMGGSLSLASDIGKGSLFSIRLHGVDISATGDPDTESSANIAYQFFPAHLLVVDDVASNRSLLIASFADTALSITEAKNGLEAVNLAKNQPFDLILMDIRMPVMDGYQAAREIKALSNTPIIALTASVMVNEFDNLAKHSFDGYLRKPTPKADLFRELGKFLPYEIIFNDKQIVDDITFSDEELAQIPQALDKLGQLIEQCRELQETNDLAEINDFYASVEAISSRHSISVLAEYEAELKNNIESFNITGIRASVRSFETLIKQLSPEQPSQ